MRTRIQHYQAWTMLVVAFIALVFGGKETLAQTDSSCGQERYSGSAKTTQATSISLINQTNASLIVYWLNFEGRRQRWFDLAPGKAVKQDTYVGHLWLVSKPNGQCVGIFAAPGQFVIGEPQSPVNTSRPAPSQNQPTAQPSTSAGGSAKDFIAQGDKYYGAKDYARAIEAYKKAIAVQPSAGAYTKLGHVYFFSRKYSEALSAHQQALRLVPNEGIVHLNLGVVYRAMEQYDNAIASYREALRLKPDYAEAFNQIGLTYYYNLEKFPEAVTAFEQAVRLKPDDASYLKYLGSAYVDTRQKAEAKQIYQRLLKMDQAKAKALNTDIEVYLYANNRDLPDDQTIEFLFTFGILSLNEGSFDQALRAFHHVIAMKPAHMSTVASAHDYRGNAFLKLKNYDKALAEFREAIRFDPKKPDYRFDLGEAYLAAGKKAEAQKIYQTLQQLDPKKAQELLVDINKAK
ncbi:MAG TPA: tetratricopeptide repeat protein [Pyrinomonadaceae bacterium]|nr:tetratricopeptide repeat protein [Pyrinomonadaceae bacterium]